MYRAFISALVFVALTLPVAAQTPAAASDSTHEWAQLAFAALGMVAAARLAWQAFGRSPVPVADVPTFPRYMTSRGQYQLGGALFVAFACSVFYLLIYEHRDVLKLASTLSIFPEGLGKTVLDAANAQSDSYLVVVAAVGVIYLYVLHTEGSWNVLLMMRDMIYRCISIPDLASRIVSQIRLFLKVPDDARATVIAATPGLVEQDFRKDMGTPDRRWAEICYMKWWITQGRDAGDDATFFAEQSFGFAALLQELKAVSSAMNAWKSGGAADMQLPELFAKVQDLHNRFARLVACYLIYRNSSRRTLAAEALRFGIAIPYVRPENPLKYWILYLIVLLLSVYIGVYVSAVGYDLAADHALSFIQDINRTFQWMMYASANYGLAIIVILLFRMAGNHVGAGFNIPHLIVYCWTFVVAFVVGPLGLGLVVHFVGPDSLRSVPLLPLIGSQMQWGTGPAFVCVYISYYLDRQSCPDMPSVDHSSATIGWRLLNAFAFAAAIVLLLVPALMSIGLHQLPGDPWSGAKLRTVATATTFALTFALALTAQFAVRDDSRAATVDRPGYAPLVPAGGA